ncbi:hypothetical protein KI387_010383 [Taxus chinensis]|uniref:Armadillo-like repeats domain-containing protein n=1 Tax=Taxus chinensis TaxID=29808 RepID=A0AA38FKU4_TAXCH|nr:hypothetical protein KI387_010383 [Taxus chinensis]
MQQLHGREVILSLKVSGLQRELSATAAAGRSQRTVGVDPDVLVARDHSRELSYLAFPFWKVASAQVMCKVEGISWRERRVSTEDSPVRFAEKGKEAENNVTAEEEEEYIEEEVELTWIQEKAEDLAQFTRIVVQAIPRPRVGQTSLPWLVVVSLAYMGLSFVIAVVKIIRKLNSTHVKKCRLIRTNAMLCRTLDELLQFKQDEISYEALKRLMRKTGFNMEEILRKYIRYALNEKPFNPDLVANLIHLRKSSTLEDGQVAEVLNEVSRRIVKEKGGMNFFESRS